MAEKYTAVRCLGCGRVWIPRSDHPRCSNRKCRSTRFREVYPSELDKMIDDLISIRDNYWASHREEDDEDKRFLVLRHEDDDEEPVLIIRNDSEDEEPVLMVRDDSEDDELQVVA